MQQSKEVIFEYLRFGYKSKIVTDENGVQFEQKSRGPKRGVLAGTLVDGKIYIGVCLLSPNEPRYTYTDGTIEIPNSKRKVHRRIRHNNIDWDKAIQIAVDRAKNREVPLRLSPYTSWQKEQIKRFMDRCGRYFKDANIVTAPLNR